MVEVEVEVVVATDVAAAGRVVEEVGCDVAESGCVVVVSLVVITVESRALVPAEPSLASVLEHADSMSGTQIAPANLRRDIRVDGVVMSMSFGCGGVAEICGQTC